MYIVYTFQFLVPLAPAPDAGEAGEELPLAEVLSGHAAPLTPY
jgi:hypothetical protein